MADNDGGNAAPTDAEQSVLDGLAPTDPKNPTGQSNEDKSPDLESLSKNVSKIATQTKMEQADTRKLNSYLLRGKTPQEIREADPELAERLIKHSEYSEIFKAEDPKGDGEGESDDADTEASTRTIADEQIEKNRVTDLKQRAMQSLTVDGKQLSMEDVKQLKGNPAFSKRFDALIAGGFDTYEAANEAFEKAYPDHAERVGRSVLSGRSQDQPYTKNRPALSDKERNLLAKFGATEDDIKG